MALATVENMEQELLSRMDAAIRSRGLSASGLNVKKFKRYGDTVYSSGKRNLTIRFFPPGSLAGFLVPREAASALERRGVVHAAYFEIAGADEIRRGWNLILIAKRDATAYEWDILETLRTETAGGTAISNSPFVVEAHVLAQILTEFWRGELLTHVISQRPMTDSELRDIAQSLFARA